MKPVVELTLQDLIRHLAATFQANKWLSLMHCEKKSGASGPLRQIIQDLSKAFGSQPPPRSEHEAVTANLVRDCIEFMKAAESVSRHTADLMEGAFVVI